MFPQRLGIPGLLFSTAITKGSVQTGSPMDSPGMEALPDPKQKPR